MNLDDKIAMVHGVSGPYIGNVPENKALGIPALSMNDGPQGFRCKSCASGSSTQWPCGLSIAASWDTAIANTWGSVMGTEFAAKGANVQLGPGVSMSRVPLCGRNFEYLAGEDPVLGFVISKAAVQGIQSKGVIANAKHYVHNNQEDNRTTVSANVDERTRMEIYAPAFEGALEGGVLSVMCSYNKINNQWACMNQETLHRDLKGYLNFSGWVMSDWGATHDTELSANNGLDQEMPAGTYFGAPLQAAVSSGKIAPAVLDDKVLRILTAMFQIGLFDHPVTGHIDANVTSDAHNQIARSLAAQSAVLLKNKNDILPWSKSGLTSLAVFGSASHSAPITGGGGSGSVAPPYQITPLQGISLALNEQMPSEEEIKSGSFGNAVKITYYQGTDLGQAAALCKASTACLVTLATTSHEGADRTNLSLPDTETQLARAVGEANPNTVAVIIAPGAVLTDFTQNVSAVLVLFMPGQEEGNAIADVLTGNVNPSGRLPLTFPKIENEMQFTKNQYPGIDLETNYTEQLNVGYRWYATHQVTPAFPFGHGLCYTSFQYQNLTISKQSIQFTLTNTGKRLGAEVSQLYLVFPSSAGEPPLQLKGFQKNTLKPNETISVNLPLSERIFSVWDESIHAWNTLKGDFGVLVGSSSSDIRLKGTITL